MAEQKKERDFMEILIDGLSYIYHIMTVAIATPIIEGSERVMKDMDDKIIQIEKRFIMKISSLLIIWFGGVFLTFALFFFLNEYLGWSKAVACFSIGIVFFVTGLIIKLKEVNR